MGSSGSATDRAQCRFLKQVVIHIRDLVSRNWWPGTAGTSPYDGTGPQRGPGSVAHSTSGSRDFGHGAGGILSRGGEFGGRGGSRGGRGGGEFWGFIYFLEFALVWPVF